MNPIAGFTPNFEDGGTLFRSPKFNWLGDGQTGDHVGVHSMGSVPHRNGAPVVSARSRRVHADVADELVKRLFAIGLQLAELNARVNTEATSELVRSVISDIDAAIRDVRELSFALQASPIPTIDIDPE